MYLLFVFPSILHVIQRLSLHPVTDTLHYYDVHCDCFVCAARLEDVWVLRPYPQLPKPTAIHHVLEDFMYQWRHPRSHLMPLRHFLDHVLRTDLRMRFSQVCLQESLLFRRPSIHCGEWWRQGQGLTWVDVAGDPASTGGSGGVRARA
jgi:hypothetical protein